MTHELNPPPSIVKLTEDPNDERIWKKWFNNLYLWMQENVNKDFYFEVAVGNVPGHSVTQTLAHDDSIGTTPATVGLDIGSLYTYSTTADIDSISSESASDTHDIFIRGMDINYEVVDQTVTLNGQNRVALTTPLLRTNFARNDTGTATLGRIHVYVNTAISAGIPTDITKRRLLIHFENSVSNERSTGSVHTIPASKTAYLIFGKVTVTDGKSMELTYWVRKFGGVFVIAQHVDIKDTNYDYLYKAPFAIEPKSDIEIRAKVASGTAEISAIYDTILIEN